MSATPQHPLGPESATLDYATARSRPNRYIFSTVACVALVIPLFVLTTIVGPVAMRFENVFKDYAVALPLLTQLLLDFGWLFRRGLWIALWLAPITLPFVIAPLLGQNPTRRRIFARLAMGLSLVLTVGMLILAVFALFLPMIKLMDSLSGK
jgi:uncharacterized membrane protein